LSRLSLFLQLFGSAIAILLEFIEELTPTGYFEIISAHKRLLQPVSLFRFQYVKYGMIPFVKNNYKVQGGGLKHQPLNILPPGILFKDLENKSMLILFPQYFKAASEIKRLTGEIHKYDLGPSPNDPPKKW
jgi:hypothetical protein